jgi:hypothetical protein
MVEEHCFLSYTMTQHLRADKVGQPAPGLATGLMKIRECQCRFIVSEADKRVLFCGAPTDTPGSSWCEWHRKIVYAPTRPRSVVITSFEEGEAQACG